MKKYITLVALLLALALVAAPSALANGPCGVNYNGNHACGLNAPTTVNGSMVQLSEESDYYVFWAEAGTQINATVTNTSDPSCSGSSSTMNSCGSVRAEIDDASGNFVTGTEDSIPYNGVTVPQSVTYTLTGTGVYYLVLHGAAQVNQYNNPVLAPYTLSVTTNSGSVQWPAPTPPAPTPAPAPSSAPVSPAAPAAQCVVPNVYRQTLGTVKHRLATHHCRLGRVYWLSRYDRKLNKGFRSWPHWRIVTAASAGTPSKIWLAGSRHPTGAKINLIGIK